ncbi:hypothetical protein JCGZ_20073 [Jatropha curcas]|uniref:Lysine-specific demethylase ELF6 n=1 Tax=Jatropha curcas TaxID=180498 RepID=A0A067LAY8_JATCU|nr:probable lysine-specific demethylase ELF6 isoform X2 [Jatropha curcas]KDP44393.1 hypothetical protein JCGZ_20073 [Jatropha curcas]
MGNVEIPRWLKDLPLAPEFRPTDTEFADPIAYISKIEKEASAFGICKIIPPLPKPSKRYVFGNLNKSLSKCPELGDAVDLSNGCSSLKTGSADGGNDGEVRAVFTTRHQELGQGMKKTKGVVKENPQLGVHKQVWQSGEIYTLDQFESKSKAFARNSLGMIKENNPLTIEALFWKAASEKPIYVEYANDVPGSGFGEPEGQFRYFHRQRRKRASYKSYRRSTESSGCKENEMGNVNNSCNYEVKDSVIKNEPSTSSRMVSKSCITSTSNLEETLKSSKRKSVNVSNDMEGTAGWKLSNSPWNLQVIARSPGSITRFMPDDIPGVTSPMVYIGMLFSWFAWHVEDHELHSMNFLHTGSPKTWYAIPGDYVFAFEEVIRNKAYGGSIDRLAALTLLGEKTTLLSPEVVVSSSIPCCRLIQNPGEFVVTFPRAYHVGFSHGFNCGEAANFGTPQWLKVAKEAAVRRAAMNYLPMLSHQQLLYLLTMSFVSRVPRSLLPGARSSRLRDRLKEERELSVKKSFIEDMLKENSILSVLLGKGSTHNVLIWNPDLLPCASKESQLPSTVATTPEENVSHIHSEDNCNTAENDLFKEMSLYMETLNDLYVDDVDISCDFQVDSGTLACVACGILGFPFMSVVQPSEKASMELLPVDHPLVQEGSRVENSDSCHASAACGDSMKSSVPDDHPPVSHLSRPVGDLPMPRGWNNSRKFLRPRIFCLEHGFQIEELLQSKGGANMLIICHSDFQKIKAHAAAIAQDIDTAFNYSEFPLETASQEDLNLIYLAIDDEDHDECGEDWTSKLGVNLRHCVKIRKNSPSNKVQHALALGGLFSDGSSSSDFLNVKWQSRRSRSRTKLNQSNFCKHHDSGEAKKDDILGKKSNSVIVKKEDKLIQYTRRKYKVKIDCSTSWVQGCPKKHAVEEVPVTCCEDLVKHTGKKSETSPCNDDICGSESAGFGLSPSGTSEVLHEVQVLEAIGDRGLNSAPLLVAGSLIANITVGHVGEVEDQPLEVSNGYESVCKSAASGSLDMQHEEKVTAGTNEIEDYNATECSIPCVMKADEGYVMQGENISLGNEYCNLVSEGQQEVLAGRSVLVNEFPDLVKPASLHASHSLVGQMENIVEEISCKDSKVCDHNLDNELKEEFQTTAKSNGSQYISCEENKLAASLEERVEFPRLTSAAEDKLQDEAEITIGSNGEKLIPSNARLTSLPNHISVDGSSDISRGPCPAVNSCNDLNLENVMQQAIMTSSERKKEYISCSVTQMEIDQPTFPSGEGCPKGKGMSAEEDFCPGSTSDSDVLLKIPAKEELVSNTATQIQDKAIPVALEEYEIPRGKCATEELSVGVNLVTEVEKDIDSDNGVMIDEVNKICQTTTEEEESSYSPVMQISQSNSVPIKKCSETEESCTAENMVKGQEVCSLHELKIIKPTVIDPISTSGKGRKRKNELEQITDHKLNCHGFIKSPCEGLRPRSGKDATCRNGIDIRKSIEENLITKKARKASDVSVPCAKNKETMKRYHKCDLEGCTMSFETKADLLLHKRNRCPYEGCRKRFSSHKYAIIHQRVHEDDRPLKCPWKGCSMSFKWAWARTEHIRVHTGEKPYKCKVEGCGLSFRFVSDFSRHRRKTGHYVNTPA